MALALPTQANAHYQHASLECFGRVAAQEITRHFETAAAALKPAPGPYSLRYDEGDHVFSLTCQVYAGAVLDAQLGRIICDYATSDSTAVAKFAECDRGNPFDNYEIPAEEDDSTTPLVQTSHDILLVNFHGMNGHSKAKAFRLRELDPVLRCRAFNRQHDDNRLQNAITFRRVRWDQSREEHVFDGILGHELIALSDEEVEDLVTLFELSPFREFNAKVAVPRSHDAKQNPRSFEFVGGEPTLKQWLEGVGETRQVDPAAGPELSEMTGDARRFAADPSGPTNPSGKIRKPSGMPILGPPETDEAVESEQNDAVANKSFAQLLGSGAGDHSDTESSDEPEDEGNENVSPTTQRGRPAITPVQIREASTPTSKRIAAPRYEMHTTPARSSAGTHENGVQGQRALSSGLGVPGPTGSEASFPKYDRSYAKMDRWGLKGDAVNQVSWENENVALVRSNQTSSGSTYEQLERSRAATVVASHSNEDNQHAKLAISRTPMSYGDTVLGGDESWANNIVPPSAPVATGVLVDTTVCPKKPGASDDFPPLRTSAQHTEVGSKPHSPRTDSMRTANTVIGRKTPLEITTDDKTSSEATVKAPNGTAEDIDDEPLIQLDDAEVAFTERIQPGNPPNKRLFRTMRQQASKKKTPKKKGKASANRSSPSRAVILERPPSPPPPRLPKDNGSTVARVQKVPNINAGNAGTDSEPRDNLQPAIDDLLASSLDTIASPEIVIQFGIALLTNAEDLTDKKAMRHADMQAQLDKIPAESRRTAFPSILGRSRKDGVYLLRLPTMLAGNNSPFAGSSLLHEAWLSDGHHTINTVILYEMTIVVPGGHEWVVTFDQECREGARINLANTRQQNVYVQYPLHVWDARIQLANCEQTDSLEVDSKLRRSISHFLKTLRTPDNERGKELPFFEGMIADAAFGVTNVLAKQIFSQGLRSGTWRVTQVWDLHVIPRQDFVVAFAKDEQAMRIEGRLWWEAALQHNGHEPVEATMNEIVEKLGYVGTCTQSKKHGGSKKKAKEVPYMPYW